MVFGRHFLICLLMKLSQLLTPGPHNTNDIFKVMGSKVTDNILLKMHFTG